MRTIEREPRDTQFLKNTVDDQVYKLGHRLTARCYILLYQSTRRLDLASRP
jgi:hypothetical protein